jgi:2-iminobutanoate/2-iminopropanoate deaminase
MKKMIINSKKVPSPIGPYSPAVMKGNFIFLSGTVGRDKDGKIVGKNDIKLQTRKTFQNIKLLLEQVGATMNDIVKVTVFLKDPKDYAGMNKIRAEYFPRNAPASTAVAIKDFMIPGLLVEIEAIAIKG